MTWYVAQVKSSSQMCGHRYRDGDVSPVEQWLARNGFAFYMPVEKKLCKDRRRAWTYYERRFPGLSGGYVFVRDVVDFELLEDTPGVLKVVRFEGRPYPMPEHEIERIRTIEANLEAEFQRDLARREFAASKLTRNKAKHLLPRGSHVLITAGHLSGTDGYVSGFDRDGKVKLTLHFLNSLSVSMPVNDLQLVAA